MEKIFPPKLADDLSISMVSSILGLPGELGDREASLGLYVWQGCFEGKNKHYGELITQGRVL